MTEELGHRFRAGAGRALVWVLASATAAPAIGEDSIEIPKIEYLGGVPGQQHKAMGWLRIDAETVDFFAGSEPALHIDSKRVEYVAAQARAGLRARSRDAGAATVSMVGGVAAAFAPVAILAWPLAAALFSKRERHLLSIDYLEGEGGTHRVVLFDVHDHSALAVKKIIDGRLGLTTQYYREKDRQEEEGRRRAEAAATPAGEWTASTNTVVGDIQYFRYLMEPGTYSVVIFEGYAGFRPAGMEWARYRVPIRTRKRDAAAGEALTPVLEGSKLVGFTHEGTRYEFY